MKNIRMIALAMLLFSAKSFAGSGIGTGNPPALQELQVMLVSQPKAAGLFVDEAGTIGLGINGQLDPILVLKVNTNGTEQQSLAAISVSEVDFVAIQSQTQGGIVHIDVTSLNEKVTNADESVDTSTVKRSYVVNEGETPGELVLVEHPKNAGITNISK